MKNSILEFQKESLGFKFLFESNIPKPNKNLILEINDRYKNLFGNSIEFPYRFKIIGNGDWDSLLQSIIPHESLMRNIYGLNELKKGFILINSDNNFIDVKNELYYNDIISSIDFNNEYYTQDNPLDSLEGMINNCLEDKEGFIFFSIIGNNILKNDKKLVYNRSDISKTRYIQINNRGHQPLSFLKKYNSNLFNHLLKLKPRDVFLYVGVIDKSTDKLISDIFVLQKDSSKLEGSVLLIPLSKQHEEYSNAYVYSTQEKFYMSLNENNKTFYGLDFYVPFNLLNNDHESTSEEIIIEDNNLNKKFIKKDLLDLNTTKSEKQFRINSNLTLKEI